MSRKYFEEEVIQQTLDYNYAQHSDANKFNISYGIDKNFLFGCGVSIASVLLANQRRRWLSMFLLIPLALKTSSDLMH
ncbi:lipopolysaccharide 1,3-galactosyltransferase [Salmonella enterica subsp. salamae]|nr:lipopolysaccharide 1,3-galactosyltransferase [Salmonella enterica subsp. salamae]